MREQFRETAENVVTQIYNELGVELKYDQESIEWLNAISSA